jgi:hypothetical protein
LNDGAALQLFLFLLRLQQTCVTISYRQAEGVVNIKASISTVVSAAVMAQQRRQPLAPPALTGCPQSAFPRVQVGRTS